MNKGGEYIAMADPTPNVNTIKSTIPNKIPDLFFIVYPPVFCCLLIIFFSVLDFRILFLGVIILLCPVDKKRQPDYLKIKRQPGCLFGLLRQDPWFSDPVFQREWFSHIVCF